MHSSSTVLMLLVVFVLSSASGCASNSPGADNKAEQASPATAEPTNPEALDSTEAKERPFGVNEDGTVSAVALRLDQADLNRLRDALIAQYQGSGFRAELAKKSEAGQTPLLVIAPFESTLGKSQRPTVVALLNKLEMRFVNGGETDVMSYEQTHESLKAAQEKFPSARREALAHYGREHNAQYVLSGRIGSDTAPEPPTQRVTYTVDMHLVDVATGQIAYETSTTLVNPN